MNGWTQLVLDLDPEDEGGDVDDDDEDDWGIGWPKVARMGAGVKPQYEGRSPDALGYAGSQR